MGNSLGGLSLYTDLEEKYEAYQGGFIWDYIDQAIETKHDDGKTVLAYGDVYKRQGIERSDAVTIPMIALSANAFIDDIQESLNSGMKDVYKRQQ